MSLFPAYSSAVNNTNSLEEDKKLDVSTNKLDVPNETWLQNASFAVEVRQIPLPEATRVLPKTPVDADNVTEEPTVVLPTLDPLIVDVIESRPTSVEPVIKPKEKKRSIDEVHSGCHSSKRRSIDKKKRKKHHRSHSQRSKIDDRPTDDVKSRLSPVPIENKCYFIDTKSERGNLSVTTLSRPAVPQYYTSRHHVLGMLRNEFQYYDQLRKSRASKKKKHEDRYFKSQVEQVIDDADSNAEGVTPQTKMEEELSKKTAEFNKTLGEEATNVDVWLEYVRFQDLVCEFERTYRRGGGAQGIKVTTERKLAILDKALTSNFNSELLLKERCRLVETVFPADEVSSQFESLLEKRPRSMAMWDGYISATQFSLSLCSVSKVVELYEKAMLRFHQMRRGVVASETKPAEENILDLLLRCGLFLRQAGLHEQMWTLIKLYIELNLNQPSIEVATNIQEKQVIDIEEPVLLSNLPLPELWVRVETLRESTHWLPWNSQDECEDPQRVVFADDVSDLLHPITTPELNFQLAMIIMTLLKVPLLPCRDTTQQWLGLSKIPWAIDSVEMLLTTLFPFGVVDSSVAELLTEAVDLAVGPTYLTPMNQSTSLGKESYLEFVTNVFRLCAEGLAEPKRTAFYIWWLRFERFLIILSESNVWKLLNKKKKIKSVIKDFLKLENNRNNLLFYREYALIEKEFGNVDGACSILLTAISTQHPNEPVIGITNVEDRSRLCFLYRTLTELLVTKSTKISSSEGKAKALNLLVALGLGVLPLSDLSMHKFTEVEREAAATKFQHIACELFDDVEILEDCVVDGTEHLLPDFLVDWLTCSAWVLYLVKTTWDAAAFLEDALKKIPQRQSMTVTKDRCRREALFESYIAMLQYHCQETKGSYSVLQEIMQRAMKEFPNNMHFLATAVRVESSEASPWWKLRSLLEGSNSNPARIFLLFLAKKRQLQLETTELGNQNNEWFAGPILPGNDASYKNRLTALFRHMINHPSTKRCPLVWRLYMKFLFQYGARAECRTTFYRAVEECPWVKALYLDGAKMLPADIQQVQDLIIEKELRLHVTPEELEILRSTDV